MKPLLRWCAVFFGLYAALGTACHLYLTQHPRTVLVALDTSFPMHPVWPQVPATLAALQAYRYALFSLVTDKTSLHTWQPQLTLGSVQPYAPRALEALLDPRRYPALLSADRVYVVTNAASSPLLTAHPRWQLVPLQPLAP
ncbi:MAG: hypothetical protein AB7N91_00020 [Candidatus Tectimicrobiota bacterium]